MYFFAMPASRQNIFFGILTILVLIPYLMEWAMPSGFETWFLMVSLAVTGIPHGAIDHVIYLQKQSNTLPAGKLLRSFFTRYLLMIGVTFVLWLVMPQIMFLFFLMVAAYHFGQSQLYYIILPGKSKAKTGLYISWGTFILASLWLFHWEQQSEIISSVFNWNLAPSGLIYFSVLSALWISLLVTVIMLLHFFKEGRLSGKMLYQESAVLGLLTLLFYGTSPFIAFAVYFGLWHAGRVILTEYQFLKSENGDSFPIVTFVKSFLPFSLLSFLGLGLLFGLSKLLQATISPFMLFLIFISALTMPHAYFMERMYHFLGKSARDGKPNPNLQIS
jgi:beta-carotene 15,15'-dioxygenase